MDSYQVQNIISKWAWADISMFFFSEALSTLQSPKYAQNPFICQPINHRYYFAQVIISEFSREYWLVILSYVAHLILMIDS